jgi:hypothetical protein
MIFKANRIVYQGPLRSALIFLGVLFVCPSWSFAQGTATGASDNASAVVVGSCNVVQQNVKAADNATIINEINCVPEKPEDSFLLRYLWLDATNSSFMVAGRFDPALARILPANPVVVKNPIFEKVQQIVTRFGLPINSETESLKSGYSYAIVGKGTSVEARITGNITGEGLQQVPLAALKKLRMYAGQERIIWPDVPSLRAVFKTQEWPSNYKMTYNDAIDSEGWKKPQAHVDFQNAAICSVLLHAPISAPLMMHYWDSMAELENTVLKKEFRPQYFINAAVGPADDYKSRMLRNKSIDAMLYFGQKSWPDDFLLAFGGAETGGCVESYYFGFYAVPRQLFTLVAVIEPRYKDLQIEHIGYTADLDEQLRLLNVGTLEQGSSPGVITVKKGEMAVIPLRMELRYDLDGEGTFHPLLDVSSADFLYKKITSTNLSTIQFKGKDDLSSGTVFRLGPLRTIFSKSIASFRPPETRKINRTYIFGPAYNLKTITIKGTEIAVRNAPAAAVAYLGQTETGSCPFLFVSNGIDDPSRVGRVLIGASKKELARVEEKNLPHETRSFFLSEQEPEVTFLETVAVKSASSGEERLVASNLVIHPGEAREFRIPENYGDAVLKIRGYYIPLRLGQSADGDAAPSDQAPN